MRFGLGIPSGREGRSVPAGFAGPKQTVKVCKLAEKLGFEVLWADDHLNASREIRARDPIPPNLYEAIVSLSYLAAETKKAKLGLGVLVLPMREPVVAARQIATLDVFSGGRVILGVGLGSRDEFDAVLPRNIKAHRGNMLNEGIQALRMLFTEDEASFKGEYYEFEGIAVNPKPAQKPFPIYIAGSAADTPKRIAQWANGCFIPRGLEGLKKRVIDLKPLLEKEGRSLADIDMTSRTIVSIARTRKEAVERLMASRIANRFTGQELEKTLEQNLIGTPSEIIEGIARLKKEGMTQCVAQNIAADDYNLMLEQVQTFGEEVIPVFKGK